MPKINVLIQRFRLKCTNDAYTLTCGTSKKRCFEKNEESNKSIPWHTGIAQFKLFKVARKDIRGLQEQRDSFSQNIQNLFIDLSGAETVEKRRH